MPPESTVRVQGEDGEGFSPSRYLERVDLSSGEVIPGPIRPEELLVASHRDVHPVDIHARYMTSRMVRATGSEEAALSKLRHMRALGRRIAVRVSHWTGRATAAGTRSLHRTLRASVLRG